MTLIKIRVADIQFAVVHQLEIAQHRHEKFKILHERLHERVYARLEQRHLQAIHKLKPKLHCFNPKLKRLGCHKGSQAMTAFQYPDLRWFHRPFQPHNKRLHGKRLRFQAAPDPSEIIWENLHHTFFERGLRQVVRGLDEAISSSHSRMQNAALDRGLDHTRCAVVEFRAHFFAKEQKSKLERQFGRPTTCPTTASQAEVVQDELNKLSSLASCKALVECNYKRFLLVSKRVGYCVQPGHILGYNAASVHGFRATRRAVNLILDRFFNGLVVLEKHHTESSLVVSRVTKIFLA
ncbi:hypothetical protein PsorP6_003860 [Peronosclerospora sorghi]|uniref:Uncharacterized protein n=1 Tax=Peronosclerospora sorghi TaxID=230839 RepID=A0ACC0VR51_9STRA|nr:hypothetical protein PsorP6_003860 [Peronosclerospora sorghi]